MTFARSHCDICKIQFWHSQDFDICKIPLWHLQDPILAFARSNFDIRKILTFARSHCDICKIQFWHSQDPILTFARFWHLQDPIVTFARSNFDIRPMGFSPQASDLCHVVLVVICFSTSYTHLLRTHLYLFVVLLLVFRTSLWMHAPV